MSNSCYAMKYNQEFKIFMLFEWVIGPSIHSYKGLLEAFLGFRIKISNLLKRNSIVFLFIQYYCIFFFNLLNQFIQLNFTTKCPIYTSHYNQYTCYIFLQNDIS
jgi:hypothetical protein